MFFRSDGQVNGQQKFARYLPSNGCGKYVRMRDEYIVIVSKFFLKVDVDVRSDPVFFPCNNIIMECFVYVVPVLNIFGGYNAKE